MVNNKEKIEPWDLKGDFTSDWDAFVWKQKIVYEDYTEDQLIEEIINLKIDLIKYKKSTKQFLELWLETTDL